MHTCARGSDWFCPNSVVVVAIITIARSQDLGIMVVISAIKMSETVKNDFSVHQNILCYELCFVWST